MTDTRLTSAITRFAFKLYAEIARQERGNIFISPASVALALAMTYNGAAGETAQAMARALELEGLGLDEVNQAALQLRRSLADAGPGVRLAIANALWGRRGVEFVDAFLRRNRDCYGAEVTTLDFGDPGASARINHWVNEQTAGKIDSIVDRLDPLTALVLVNAIYFKGAWSRPFDPASTRPRPFTLLDGRRKQHPAMAQSGSYRYYQGRGFQAVSLPYGAERVSMDVVVPDEPSDFAAFQRSLSAASWETWVQGFRKRKGSIVLPRFRIEYGIELRQALDALGMGVAFEGRRANFEALCDQKVSIGQVRHKTFVEVNEEGTEAAAATAVTMTLASFIPEPTFKLIVDRPFFCAIRDNQTGMILFMGSIVDPQ